MVDELTANDMLLNIGNFKLREKFLDDNNIDGYSQISIQFD